MNNDMMWIDIVLEKIEVQKWKLKIFEEHKPDNGFETFRLDEIERLKKKLRILEAKAISFLNNSHGKKTRK